jgi:hypothetical protein
MTQKAEDFLSHHGVIGMHWGRHLPGKTEASHNPSPGKAPTHEDHSTAHDLAKKPIRTLSNHDLKTINSRFEMERKVSTLKSQSSTLSKGQKKIAVILGIAGTATTIYNLANSPAGKSAIKAGTTFIKKLGTKAA